MSSSFDNSLLVENKSFFSNEYCTIGNVGCYFLITANTLPILYLLWMLYKAIPLWKQNFSFNKIIFYKSDAETHTIRNIVSYGLKIFLNTIAALEALINTIILPLFHEKGWMVIMQTNITNFIFCFLISLFIYLDAITFHKTKRHTLQLLLINILQNIVIFSILIATQNGKNIDIFCFITSCLYLITCILSSIYILKSPLDTIDVFTHQQYNDMLNHSHISSSNNVLNSSIDQNLLQQHTTLDYYQAHSSKSQLYQPPSYNNVSQQSPTKQSKIEDEKSIKSNKSKQSKQVSLAKYSNQNMNNNTNKVNNNINNIKNDHINNSNNKINIANNNTSLLNNCIPNVQRSQSAKNQALITPEDSFNSINYNVSDDDETCDQKSNNPSNNRKSSDQQGQRENNRLKLQDKRNEYLDQQCNVDQRLTSYQIQRMNLNNRSKSSIQCLGRQDVNQSNGSLQKNVDLKDKNRIDQKISDFFVSEKLSGSVDIMGNDDLNTNNQNVNNTRVNQDQQMQLQKRQQAGEINNLHQSVDYMGCSNQFVTPSFNNNHQGLEQQSCYQTNSSSNRDSLYLSQQITTPQFNNIHQIAASSHSSSSSKKLISSTFFLSQHHHAEEQQSKKPSIFSSNQIIAEPQSPLQISCSPSIGAESQETHDFGSATVNSNEISEDIYSNQKQDSFQTSDSYLMNGGQNANQIQGGSNQNYHNIQTQKQLLQQQQNAFQKAIKDSKAAKSPQNIKNISSEVYRKKSQNSKQKIQNHISTQDISHNNTNNSEQQNVLNQMNDLLFKNRSQQKQQTQNSPLLIKDTSDKHPTIQHKVNKYEKEKSQQVKTPKNSPKDGFTKEIENFNEMQNSRNRDNQQEQIQKSSSIDSQDESIGYYRERYTELAVFSFNQSEKFDKKTIVFNISYFDSKGEKVIIQRSYREFNDLHKYLSFRFKNIEFSLFPKKQNKLQLSSQELNDRTGHFNSYLQSVIYLIRIEIPVINHFLSKDTTYFQSQAVTKNNTAAPLTPSEQTQKVTSQSKHKYKKLNSLPNNPRSVPETILEDSNDRSNVLTDSNTSQTENDEDYSTMSCNYQSQNKINQIQQQSQLYNIKNPPNNNQMNSTVISNKIEGYSSQSSKTVSPNPSRKTSGKQ